MEGVPDGVLQEIVARALAEDVGTGDITTAATVPQEARASAEIAAKEEGVVAGLPAAEAVFRALDPGISFHARVRDGDRVAAGQVVARISGRAHPILTGERTALNFLQRMSGIATLTARYVEAVKGTRARILDTRKTAPGLRLLDKYAVRIGGGQNHRMGLFDAVLIKDNHIRAAGGIAQAVRMARERAPEGVTIEVEAQTAAQVEEAAAAGVDVIMLDNMSLEGIRGAVAHIAGRCQIEVSGGVNLDTVRAIAECGVDYISVGALTHSAPALDFSLEVREV